jgi:RNA polymerase sigma-70 factor (ECF subfamily)
MTLESGDTGQMQHWLDRWRCGDRAARDEMIRHAGRRLERFTRRLLHDFPGVQRWEQTDDVLQSALVRLLRALESTWPESVRGFFGLANEQIRRELIDLARHYYGPEGTGANHASRAGADSSSRVAYEKSDTSLEPQSLAEWREFHEHIEQLPAAEREVVGLLFYQGLSQAEAAAVLQVTVRTVQRRWHSALLKMHQVLNGEWPGS